MGECVSVVFVWWGILCPLPPRRGGGWGHRGGWGGMADGGWHGGGRAAVLLDSPSNVGVPSFSIGVPSLVRSVAMLKGGVWCVLCCPVFGLGLAPCIVRSPRIVPVPLLSCVAVFVWVEKCGVWIVPRLSSSVFVFAVTALLV